MSSYSTLTKAKKKKKKKKRKKKKEEQTRHKNKSASQIRTPRKRRYYGRSLKLNLDQVNFKMRSAND